MKPNPCPFCGSTDTDPSYASLSNGNVQTGCYTCDATGPSAPTPELATTKWNATTANRQLELATQALQDIVDPIAAIIRKLPPTHRLNGVMAIYNANDPNYLKSIARQALENVAALAPPKTTPTPNIDAETSLPEDGPKLQ